ncbi:MAG TPA: GGDEF domain-containing protein [Firmicutes bacterium]|jgi:diguanylate cyclase (GGDEF)-like protein|nr:GGDEF domain-containing protein [Bacillota bacterium]
MHTAAYLIDIAALFYLMGLLHSNTSLNAERQKPFLIAVTLTISVIVLEAATIVTNNYNLNLRGFHILCNTLGFALAPLIPLAIALIFDRMILEKHRIMLLPTVLNAAAAALSPVFGWIFTVDAANNYTRGDFFFAFVAVYATNLLCLIIATVEVAKRKNYPIVSKMAGLGVFTFIGTSVQLLFPSSYTSWHCVTLSLLLYLLLMSEFDSSFDTLTNVYNRAAFDKQVKRISEAKGKDHAFSLIMLDIDDFKAVNDTYGHDCGDDVIKAVAAVVRESFDKRYTCYRVGGDEFSLIGSETDAEKIEEQLANLKSGLARLREEGAILPTVSCGYSVYIGGEKLNFHKVLKEADGQMYHNKLRTKGREKSTP